MAKFIEQVQETRPEYFVAPGVVDRSSGAMAKAISSGIQGALDVRDRMIMEDYRTEFQDLEEQDSMFSRQEDELNRKWGEALTRNDLDTVESINQQLNKLDRGAATGVVSRKQAAVRRKTLVRGAISQYPWLGPEIRKMASLYSGSGGRYSGGGGGGVTAEEKARQELNIQALKSGVSQRSVIEAAQYEFERDQEEARGVDGFAGMDSITFKNSRVAVQGLLSKIYTDQKADPTSIDSADWIKIIADEKMKQLDLLHTKVLELKESGISFSREQVNGLKDSINTAFTDVEAFTEAKDKNKYLSNQRKALEDGGVANMHKFNPGYANLLDVYGPDVAMKMQSKIFDYNKMILNGATLHMIREAAKTNPEAMIFLQHIKMSLPHMYPDMFKKMGQGDFYLNNKYMDMYMKGLSAKVMGDPDMPPELKDKARREINLSTTPTDFLAYSKPEVFGETIKDAGAVEGVRNARDSFTASVVNKVNERMQSEDWGVGFSGGRFVRTDQIGKAGVNPAHGVPEDSDIDLLNKYMNISRQYGLDTDIWIEGVMQQFRGLEPGEKEGEIDPNSPAAPSTEHKKSEKGALGPMIQEFWDGIGEKEVPPIPEGYDRRKQEPKPSHKSDLPEESRALLKLIDKTESGGDYNILLGSAEKQQFKGVKITNMTLDEVIAFQQSPDYKSYSKSKVGRVATPVGRYQIVGKTLRALKSKLGLSGEERFDEDLQDELFQELLRGRLTRAGGDVNKAVRELRNEWEGLKHVSTSALKAALQQLMASKKDTTRDFSQLEPGKYIIDGEYVEVA